MPEPLAEVWMIGFDGVDLTAAYATEAAAKAAVMVQFTDHWTAKGVTKTAWMTYDSPWNKGRRRQSLLRNSPQHYQPEPFSNTGWFVQPVPIAAEAPNA